MCHRNLNNLIGCYCLIVMIYQAFLFTLLMSFLSILDRVCGDIFTGPSGSFATPRYPSTYPPNTTCLWQIRVPGASKIFVEFDNFQLEEGQRSSLVSCNEDYLLYLQDGEFPSQFGAKKRCGRDLTPIIFDRDKAWIEFVSNGANNFPGFFARYRAVTEPGRITKLPETTTSTTGTCIISSFSDSTYFANSQISKCCIRIMAILLKWP